jgi:hypothetical protein
MSRLLGKLIPPLQLSQEGRESLKRRSTALTEKQIQCGVPRSTRGLDEVTPRHTKTTNHRPEPFVRTKTAHEFLARFALFCKQICD